MEAASIDGRCDGAWGDRIWSDAKALSEGEIPAGFQLGDVREGRETPQTEMTPFYPRSPMGCQGVRALPDGELQGELWTVCVLGNRV